MSKRTVLLFCLCAALLMPMCSQRQATPPSPPNPLLAEWTTPLGVPPFGDFKPEDFLPAFKEAIAEQRREVDNIAASRDAPSFVNTLEALDAAGWRLSNVNRILQNLAEAETNDKLQAVRRDVAPMLTAAQDDIRMNAALFSRIKKVWEERDRLSLTPVQQKLLADTYRSFVRGGANLDAAQKERLRKVNADLATLGVKFGENLLHDTNAFRLVVDRKEDLAGLPDAVVATAADAAREAGLAGKWVFTLQAPSIWPFMQYAGNRDLRHKILEAYISRCDHGDQYDNKDIVLQTTALRAERASLVGYKTFAEYQVDEYMAKTPARVYDLLTRVWGPAKATSIREAAALQQAIRQSGGTFKLEPWDWRFYTEKIRAARFNLDEQALRPYFTLNNVRDGAFMVATKLYGLTFTPRPDLPVYNPEVRGYEVKDGDGRHIGVLYLDFHPRPGKTVGAWTDTFREHAVRAGREISVVAVIVCNFSRPSGDAPALLNLEEVETLFHEFGHALHVLLDRSPYRALSAFSSSMPSDFVELQSSIMENWALEPEVLKDYARHYRTGEVIPGDLVEKIKKARQFNQGFLTVEYLAASFLDMDWHGLTKRAESVPAFEQASMSKIGLPPQIVVRYKSPYFSHVFGPGGGYAAGYYSYIWSEVLDADAFELFKQKGIFDQATARSFRTNILEAAATEDAMTLYRRFRGADPSVEPLLARRGLK